MHELAIAECVIDIARRHANGRRVAQVNLKVGHLRQVVPSALTFAFELIARGTELEGVQVTIDRVPAVGVCRNCGASTVLWGFPFQCRGCGGLCVDVIEGEELLVDSLELEDWPERAVTTK